MKMTKEELQDRICEYTSDLGCCYSEECEHCENTIIKLRFYEGLLEQIQFEDDQKRSSRE